jgi:hypothetical protein
MPFNSARTLLRAIDESGLLNKLLSRELIPSEQQLRNSFKTDQIYRVLTGEPDTVPEFRFNWYTVTGGDAMAEFILVRTRITAMPAPPAEPTVIPVPKIKTQKACTSAVPVPSSSTSSSSPASTVPPSPL